MREQMFMFLEHTHPSKQKSSSGDDPTRINVFMTYYLCEVNKFSNRP